MCHCFSIDGPLSCFHVFAIVDFAAISTGLQLRVRVEAGVRSFMYWLYP